MCLCEITRAWKKMTIFRHWCTFMKTVALSTGEVTMSNDIPISTLRRHKNVSTTEKGQIISAILPEFITMSKMNVMLFRAYAAYEYDRAQSSIDSKSVVVFAKQNETHNDSSYNVPSEVINWLSYFIEPLLKWACVHVSMCTRPLLLMQRFMGVSHGKVHMNSPPQWCRVWLDFVRYRLLLLRVRADTCRWFLS